MKKRVIVLLLVLAMVTVLLSGCGSSEISIKLLNALGTELTQLYVRPQGQDWSESYLSSSLFGGDSTAFSIPEGKKYEFFDFSAYSVDGIEFLFELVPLKSGSTVELRYEGEDVAAVVTLAGNTETVYGEKIVPLPTPDDPLSMSAPLLNFPGGLEIPYPSTMQVLDKDDRQMSVFAVREDAPPHAITINMMELSNYDHRFSNAANAENALVEIKGHILPYFEQFFVKDHGYDFVDAGNYYGLKCYFEVTGTAINPHANGNLRVVMELRYFGATGYLLEIDTFAFEGDMDNYYAISKKIADNINFGKDYRTSGNSGGGGGSSVTGEDYYEPNDWDWSDPGDTGDYDPWSDPGDTGDYDPWSDPGDTWDYDPWSDPGDTWDY